MKYGLVLFVILLACAVTGVAQAGASEKTADAAGAGVDECREEFCRRGEKG